MKTILASVLSLLAASSLASAVTYVDLANTAISDVGEIHINLSTGLTYSSVDLLEYDDDPWLSFYFGGTVLGTSTLVGVWTNQTSGYDGETTGHFFQNVSLGSTVSSLGVSSTTGSFSESGVGSQYHVESGAGSFTRGEEGYLAFGFMTAPAGLVSYGWLRFSVEEDGSGILVDYARSDTPGEAITVGVIPEPSSIAALAGAFGLGFAAYRRRRVAV